MIRRPPRSTLFPYTDALPISSVGLAMQDYKAEPSYGSSRVEPPPRRAGRLLVEQFGEFLSHGATELLGIDDDDSAAGGARAVVTAPDRDEFHRRARLGLLDYS